MHSCFKQGSFERVVKVVVQPPFKLAKNMVYLNGFPLEHHITGTPGQINSIKTLSTQYLNHTVVVTFL